MPAWRWATARTAGMAPPARSGFGSAIVEGSLHVVGGWNGTLGFDDGINDQRLVHEIELSTATSALSQLKINFRAEQRAVRSLQSQLEAANARVAALVEAGRSCQQYSESDSCESDSGAPVPPRATQHESCARFVRDIGLVKKGVKST